MTPTVFLDPLLFIGWTESPQTLARWAGVVASWNRTMREHGVECITSRACMELIWDAGLAPQRPRCQQLLSRCPAPPADGATVSRFLLQWLQREPYLEDGLSHAVIAERETAVSDPPEVLTRLTPELHSPLVECLLAHAVWRFEPRERATPPFATLLSGSAEEIEVAAVILAHDATEPAPHARRFHCIADDTDAWLHCYSLPELLGCPATPAGLRRAIICAHRRAFPTGDRPLVDYSVGSRFLADFESNIVAQGLADRVVDDLAILLSTDGERHSSFGVEAFRTGRGGNDPQLVRARDQARAFRAHLSKGARPIKLHYWRRPSGVKELANVGAREDFYDFTQ